MKNVLAFLIMLFFQTANAGVMKEIWSMTNESVLETLGFEEGMVVIDNYQFVRIDGADLAVRTTVKVLYPIGSAKPTFFCVTTYKKDADFYSLLTTDCK